MHALHPYLGKFVPQLVEVFLRRLFRPGQAVYDPFCGSGTTLVEANVYGCHAAGCDVSAFNCLMARVKTGSHRLGEVELALRGALEAARQAGPAPAGEAGEWARTWFRRPSPRRAPRLPRRRNRTRPGRTRGRVARAVSRRPLGSANTALRPRLPARCPSSARTGATSTGARAGRSVRRPSSCDATRTTRSPACARSPSSAATGGSPSCTTDARTVDAAMAGARDRHLTAVSRADRLPRATPLRLRAARPRGSARRRDRPSGARPNQSRASCLRRRDCRDDA